MFYLYTFTAAAIDMNGDANGLIVLDILGVRNSNRDTCLIKHGKITRGISLLFI